MGLTLGELVREKRLEKGYSQIQLGKGIVTPSMISQIELGRVQPSYGVLQALAKRLDAPIEYFLAPLQEKLEGKSKLNFALWLKESQNYRQAIPVLESLLQDEEWVRDDVSWHLIECYIKEEQYEKAESILNSLFLKYREERSGKKYVLALETYAQIKMDMQEYDVARTYWERACKYLGSPQNAKEAKFLYNIALCFARCGKHQEAIQHYLEAYKILSKWRSSGQLADLCYELAVSYRNTFAYKQAERYVNQALGIYQEQRLEHERMKALLEYGALLIDWERWDEGKEKILACKEEALRLRQPAFVRKATRVLAEVSWLQGDDREAEQLARSVLQEETEDQGERAHAHFILGKILKKRKKWYTAMEHLQKAAAILSSLPAFYRYIQACIDWADCHQQVGEFEQAIDILTRVHETAANWLEENKIML